MSTRRDFLRALALGTGAILVPQYGGWYRQGSGVLVPQTKRLANAKYVIEVADTVGGPWRAIPIAEAAPIYTSGSYCWSPKILSGAYARFRVTLH